MNGCLATYVGKPALTLRIAELRKEFPDSLLQDDGSVFDAIESAALNGDPLALKLVNEIAGYLGIAISGWFNLMNPNLAILGGGLAGLGELLLAPLRSKIRNSTLVSKAAVDIKTSELGPRAVAIGAATLALIAMFDDPNLAHQADTAEAE
jgi:predicted NBD/HSP70 family sugar kinase